MAAEEISEIFTPNGGKGVLRKMERKNKILITVFVLVLVAVGGYFLFQKMEPGFGVRTSERVLAESTDALDSPDSLDPLDSPDVVDRSEPVVSVTDSTNYKSENFRVGKVALGGEAEFFVDAENSEPLAITSIRGETFTEKDKKEVKLVVSWQTNVLAKSEISYSKGVGQQAKKITEEDYGLNHSVIISGLDQASTYVYVIDSSDRFGNTIVSDPHAVYTGSRTVSLFDLIANAIGSVFGWAAPSP